MIRYLPAHPKNMPHQSATLDSIAVALAYSRPGIQEHTGLQYRAKPDALGSVETMHSDKCGAFLARWPPRPSCSRLTAVSGKPRRWTVCRGSCLARPSCHPCLMARGLSAPPIMHSGLRVHGQIPCAHSHDCIQGHCLKSLTGHGTPHLTALWNAVSRMILLL